MISRIILTFFIFTLSIASSFALSLKYGSKTCQQFRDSGKITETDISTCFENFKVTVAPEGESLAPDVNDISQHIIRVGTLENLSTILKNKFLNNAAAKYKQNLILTKGMGLDDAPLKRKIKQSTASCTQYSDKLSTHLEEVHDTIPKASPKEISKLKKNYTKKLYSAYVEIHRLENLLKINKKYRAHDKQQINKIQKDLENIYKHYPLLTHIDKKGINSTRYSKSFVQRMMLKLRMRRPEQTITHSYETHPEINKFLDIKENNQQTKFVKTKRPFQNKNPYLYKLLHEKIQNSEYKDAFFEKKIEEAIMDSANNSLDSIKKICNANPCKMFSYAPYEVADMINNVTDSYTKDQLTQAACECKIGYQKETISTGIHLGLVAGTIGLAVGCVAFPPLCIGALTLGFIGTAAGLKDYQTVSENNENLIEESRVISSRSEFDKNYQLVLADLDESNKEMFMANVFLPLEFLGGAGDVVASLKHAPKVISKFTKGSKAVDTPVQHLDITITKPTDQLASSLFDSIGSRETLLNKFLAYDPTSDIQRADWIKSAKAVDADLYLDIENGALKRINDLGDKDSVTALTNLHKRLVFEKIEKLKKKYPGIKIDSYSDFKSSRFAFSGDIPPGFQKELNEAYQEVGEDLNNIVLKLMKNGEIKIPLSETPKNWFAGGIGKSADEAGLAARESRCASGQKRCFPDVKSYHSIKGKLENALTRSNQLRNSIAKRLKKTNSNPPLLDVSPDGNTVPSLELIEVIRKNLDKTDSQIEQLLANTFKGANLDKKSVKALRDYTHSLKKFEPGIWNESRQLASLDEAANGGFSADFTGMGSHNLLQIAKDLADNQNNITKTVDKLRKGEESVTQMFDQRKQKFMQYAEEIYSDFNIPVEKICSGDDCVVYPKKNLGISPAKQEELERAMLAKINSSDAPNGFRLSFIPSGAQREARSELATQGELIEKQIRKKVYGTTSATIDVNIGQKTTIGIKMPKTLGKGKVKVLIKTQGELTKNEIKIVKEKTLEAINEVNKALNNTAKEAGSTNTTNYSLKDIIIE